MRTGSSGPSSRPAALLGPAELRELAGRLDVRPRAAYGQHFLVDPNTVRRLVAVAGVQPDDVVLEIGPGLGSLTLGLAAAAGRVVAVEVDPALAAALPGTVAERVPDADVEVICADALDVDRLPGPAPTALAANLPYNVAVPVLLRVLERFPSVRRGLVMVQREVAERLAARPGGRRYGVPSVKAAWWAELSAAGPVPRAVFWPRPRVDSALVAFTRRPPPAGERAVVFGLVDAAFAARRKTLRNALAAAYGSPDAAAAALGAAGIDPGLRGEALDLAAFARLAASAPPRSGSRRSGSRRSGSRRSGSPARAGRRSRDPSPPEVVVETAPNRDR